MSSKKLALILLVLAIFVVVGAILALCLGEKIYSFKELFHLFTSGEKSFEAMVLIDIRLPRVLAALSIGAALSLSGTLYQGVMGNVLVSPSILGVLSGASFGAALAMILGMQETGIEVLCFLFGRMGSGEHALAFSGAAVKNHKDSILGYELTSCSSNIEILVAGPSPKIKMDLPAQDEPMWVEVRTVTRLGFKSAAVKKIEGVLLKSYITWNSTSGYSTPFGISPASLNAWVVHNPKDSMNYYSKSYNYTTTGIQLSSKLGLKAIASVNVIKYNGMRIDQRKRYIVLHEFYSENTSDFSIRLYLMQEGCAHPSCLKNSYIVNKVEYTWYKTIREMFLNIWDINELRIFLRNFDRPDSLLSYSDFPLFRLSKETLIRNNSRIIIANECFRYKKVFDTVNTFNYRYLKGWLRQHEQELKDWIN